MMQALLALAATGLVLAALANVEPILTLNVAGNRQSNEVATGVLGLVGQGYWPVGGLVFFAAVVGPVLHLVAVGYLAAACCVGRRWPGVDRLAGVVERLAPWNLVMVYAVGILVAVVRLELLGEVEWRRGSLWILLLAICSMVVVGMFDRVAVEERVATLR